MKKSIMVLIIAILTTGKIFAQELSLKEVITQSARGVEESLPQGTMVAVLNFSSPSETFSDYVIEELTGELVTGKKLAIVDRQNLTLIRNEMNLQMSGDVSDESAQAIGKLLGAQAIVSGTLTNMGTYHRFRIRVISVETGRIQTQVSLDLQNDRQVAFLLGGSSENSTPARRERNRPAKPTEEKTGDGLDNSKWFSVGVSGAIGGFVPGFTGMIGDMYDEELFGGMQANLTFFEHYGTYGKFFWLPNAFFVEISNMFLWVRPYDPDVGEKNNDTNDTLTSTPILGLGALWNIRLGESQKWITHFGLSFNAAWPDFYLKYEYEDVNGWGETKINGGLVHSLVYFVGIHGGIRYRFTDFISAELTAKYLIALNDPSPPTGFFDGRQPKEPIKVNYSNIQMFLGIRLSIPYSIFSRK